MAACMAGRCEDADLLRSETVRVLIADGFIQIGDSVTVSGWADDGAAELTLQLRIAADMVGVMMGVEDVRRPPAQTVEGLEHGSRLAGVDYTDSLACGVLEEIDIIVAERGDELDIHDEDVTPWPWVGQSPGHDPGICFVLGSCHNVYRCHRSARVLRKQPRPSGPEDDSSSRSRVVARCPGTGGSRSRLRSALSAPFPGGGGADDSPDAGLPGGRVLAVGRAGIVGAGRRGGV